MSQLFGAELRISSIHGRGLYATTDIKTGTIVWKNNFTASDVKDWKSYTRAEVDKLSGIEQSIAQTYYEIAADGRYYGPPTLAQIEQDASNFFNHSCQPNLQFKNDDILVALNDIKKGDELVYDYGTAKPLPIDGFSCACAKANCRKYVSWTDYKKLKHLGMVSFYG